MPGKSHPQRSLESPPGGAAGPGQPASVRRDQGRATRFQAAAEQTGKTGDQRWLRYAADDCTGQGDSP